MASTAFASGLDVAIPAGQLGILRRNPTGRGIEDGECSESDLGFFELLACLNKGYLSLESCCSKNLMGQCVDTISIIIIYIGSFLKR